jgi:hypothetical protein
VVVYNQRIHTEQQWTEKAALPDSYQCRRVVSSLYRFSPGRQVAPSYIRMQQLTHKISKAQPPTDIEQNMVSMGATQQAATWVLN